ncbi:MAG: magnesium transporter [Alphaproteobacteria bacterium]|nr:MAG: magnesium transporter [Alphaproteobacteria bacterium]
MILAFRLRDDRLEAIDPATGLESADWIDLVSPSAEEVAAVAALGVDVPSPAEMEEIEPSSRLYRRDGTDYMTIVLPVVRDVPLPRARPVSFILAPERLVTVRHHPARAFEQFTEQRQLVLAGGEAGAAHAIFLGLIDAVVDRLADLLEGAGRQLEGLMASIYAPSAGASPAPLRDRLADIGRQGELVAQVRQGLVTLERALGHSAETLSQGGAAGRAGRFLAMQQRDIAALTVHADFLSARLGQAADATLGLINLDQNNTVRIISVVTALFLPPTLIASIYGMNFEFMPELSWPLGYPLALILMALSSWGTWLYFRRKGWL